MRKTLLALTLFVTSAGIASAQQDDLRIPDGKALGVTVDRFTLDDEYRYTTITVHLTRLNAGGLSPNFGFGLFPTVLRALTLATEIDGGLGYNIAVPHVTMLPHIGVASLFVLSPYGTQTAVGYHAGISILVNFRRTDAIRIDLTHREYFQHSNELTSSLSLGIGISSVQPRTQGDTP